MTLKQVVEHIKQRRPDQRVNGSGILTEGDLVWVLVRGGGGRRAQFNQYRVQDGMLAEHWGVYQDVPDARQNGNTFFGFGRGPAPDFSR